MTESIEIVRPHPLQSFPVGALGAPGVAVVTGDVYLAGWSLRELTGAAVAQADLIDGTDATGRLIATINFAAGANSTVSLGGHMLVARTGLFLAVGAGTITGALWFADRLGTPGRRHRGA